MGRPMKLSEERTEMICNAMEKGCTVKTACQLAGITVRTMERWCNRAEDALEKDPEERSELEMKLIDFRRAIYHARVEQKETLENVIMDAADGGKWRAALAYLERQYPGDWSKTQRIEHKDVTPREMGWADEDEIEDAEVRIVDNDQNAEKANSKVDSGSSETGDS